jgi:hypothetical protein
MRTALTLAASVVINLTALAAFDSSISESRLPKGNVTITQLPDPALIAAVRADDAVVRKTAKL